ncbi:MAG: NAD(P)-dependent oxidoreductase [Terrimicrobiaceae bacterium]
MNTSRNDTAEFPLMADKNAPLSDREAKTESLRCLFCYDAPCIAACPTGIDIPSFIRKISTGHAAAAAKTILTANILGASCARVCPTQVLCEGACVVGHDYEPVKIGLLQRYATDFVMERGLRVLEPAKNSTGFKIAVIGGGPAGLGCSAELSRLGHKVVVFEKDHYAGGLNTYGIAYYKMKPQVSLEEVDLVKSLGVEIRTGVAVGKDISAAALLADYDAVFVGIGLGRGVKLGVPGEDGPGVREALDFIRDIHELPLAEIVVGKNVLVIGGGNTAIDAVDQAKRLGAQTATMAYRRGHDQMSAYQFEQELARKDSCQILFNAEPLEILRDSDGQVTGMKFRRTAVDASGKMSPVPGSEWIHACDQILLAIGQLKQHDLLKKLFPALAIDAKGRVEVDPLTGATSLAKVFSGGDCANGGKEVVNAVGEGKKSALAIHKMLVGENVSPHIQASRYGVGGEPVGSGILKPVRVKER